MFEIAGGIVLGVLCLAVIGRLGADEEGNFSFGILFGNTLAIVFMLGVLAAVVVGGYLLWNKSQGR